MGGAAGIRKHLSSGFCTSHWNFISLRRCIFDAYAWISTDLLRILGLSLCVFATKLTAGGFNKSHFFRLGPYPVPGVSFSPGMAPWCWCSLLPMCELAPFQCSALAAWAACSLDLGVRAWAGVQFGGYQAWRFTEHMTTICALCGISALSLSLVGWAVAGWAGWLAGWCSRQQKTSF